MRKLILAATLLLAACTGGDKFSNSAGPVSAPVSTGDLQVMAGKPTMLRVSSVSVTEGETAHPVINLSGGNGRPVTVQWTAGSQTGSVTLSTKAPATLSVPTVDDSDVNGTRTQQVCAKAVSGTTGASACGTMTILDNDVAPTQACSDGSVIPADQPCPAPPPPSGWVPSPSLHGLPDIASNFNISDYLVPGPTPGSAAADLEGAFRFLCAAGPVLADDPIVFPGQPGKSHLHQFYGNTGANAYSTYESLRTTGQSTCVGELNRSGYWMPALLDGKGNVVRPDYVAIYYKRRPASDPVVSDPTAKFYEGQAVPLPNGLRFIFGWDPTGINSARTGAAWFNCDGPTAVPGRYDSIPEAAAHCPAGNRIGAVIFAPNCWDGKNLDSPDHRSHVAYSSYGSWGYLKCDAAHPYVIPQFTLGAWYSIAPGEDASTWRFSSDDMAPGMPAGYTFHADWFGAWDQPTLKTWTDNCINRLLSCNSGNLGDGTMMKQIMSWTGLANPRLVPISTIPQTPVR
jgi:hypothetical protein